MPVPIQFANAAEALRKHFGLQGSASLQLDEVVVPVAVVAELAATEDSPLGDIYTEQLTEAAVAGEHGIMQFEGNARFNMLPDRVYVLPNADGNFSLRIDTAAVAPVFTGTSSTQGIGLGNVTAAGPVAVTTGTIATANIVGNVVGQFAALAAEGVFLNLRGWRLRAGQRLYVINDTANTTVRFAPYWRAEQVDRA